MVDARDVSFDVLMIEYPGFPAEVALHAKARIAQLERELAEARAQSVGDWSSQRENDALAIQLYETRAELREAREQLDQERRRHREMAEKFFLPLGVPADVTAIEAERDRLAAETAGLEAAIFQVGAANDSLAKEVERLTQELVTANAELADMEFLSIEGFIDWKRERRAALQQGEQP